MAQQQFRKSAPGSLMIMGEYAVLYGHTALVAAIDKKIHVCITPRDDKIVNIKSGLGELTTDLDNLEKTAPFTYVMETLKKQKLIKGADIIIESEFSSRQGLGSSAAVTVALTAAIYESQGKPATPLNIYHAALEIVREVQGDGSGADIAASIFGGLLAYRQKPLNINAMEHLIPLTVVFSGKKTATSAALARIRNEDPEEIENCFEDLGKYSEQAMYAIMENDLKELGRNMNKAQNVMYEFGLSTPEIDNIIASMLASGIEYSKISGSGLGDCVIGLGEADTLEDFTPLPVKLSREGLT